ncbi:hypothetical protein OpiT1DRAFT_04628 [Opitutaceae bacterium TAV1]|nr:hypothetical protein OpiT1DRAFT_04628 [Opitutaceae bacterium TAV1]
MKTIRNLLLASSVLLVTAAAFAAKPVPGPKGGRILTTEAPWVEFFVEKDRTVAITFYDKDLKPVAPGTQVVNAIAEAGTGKVKLDFGKTASGFVSRQPLPEGDGYTVVVQIRDTAKARPKNHRVRFHDEVCGECKRAEYACLCEETGGHQH